MDFSMDLKMLRAISQTQIQTLATRCDSPELFKAEIVGKILENDNCIDELQVGELAEVLIALGFRTQSAWEQAEELKRNH